MFVLVPVSLAAHSALQAGCWEGTLLQVEIRLSVTLCYALQFHPVSAALVLSSSNSLCMTWSPLTLCTLEFMEAGFHSTSCAKVNNKTFKNACHSLVLGELCWQPASSPIIWLSALPCIVLMSLNCSLPMYSFSVHLCCNCSDSVASFEHLLKRKKNVLRYPGCGNQLTHFF